MGSGSHGEVWRAADLRLSERSVALKRALHGGDHAAAARIRREAQILAGVSHPNVVTVLDTVTENGDSWIVMEYVSGDTLADIGTVSPQEAARYGAQLAGGLEAVHAIGIFHRDIKPANVLITDQGFAKLADFGISRDVHSAATLTGTGAVTGTPGYVAPEVVKGGEFTAAADVFSLGATLFKALEGTSPFGEDSAHALLWKTVTEDVPRPVRASNMAPVLMRMLDKEPKRRPAPGQARRELAQLCGDPTIGAGRRSRPPFHSRPSLLTAAGAAVALLAVAGWVALDRQDDSRTPSAEGSETPTVFDGAGASTDIIGDEVTADPCALLDEEALAEFGDTRIDTDDGIFNGCDLFVDAEGAGEVDIDLEIWRTSAQPPPGDVEMVGQIGVVRSEDDMPEECDRELVLPDGNYIVSLDAKQHRGSDADLCALADAAVASAVAMLNDGQIPRRQGEPDPKSLVNTSACDLLDNEALERFPGVDATHPIVSFGEWDCTWDSTTSGNELRVLFQRSDPLGSDHGVAMELAGREAFLQGDRWSDDSCLVSIVHRQEASVDGDGSTTAELVRVQVLGDDSLDELCEQAVDLAEAAAAALPQA